MYQPLTSRVKTKTTRKRIAKRHMDRTADKIELDSMIESAQPIDPIRISRRQVKRMYHSPSFDQEKRFQNGISVSLNRSKLSPPGTADCKSNNHKRSMDLLFNQIPENPMKSEENATQQQSQEGQGFFNTIPI